MFRENVPIYKYASTLKQNNVFGHIAIAYTNHRTATIVSRDPTHLVSLDKKFFTEICSQINNETEHMLSYLKDSFPGLSNDYLANLLSKMEEKSYKLGDILYNVGDNPKFCFIVKQGEVTVF